MNASHHIASVVQAFLDHERIRGQPIIVAVSGGPDSMALLRALQITAPSFDLQLIAAHLNHQLRGEESLADEQFVCDYCRRQPIEVRAERLNISQSARDSGENLEAAARRLRYDWLTRIAQEYHAPFIATGHTADDQAETVLHHLIRGTGLRGLRGIAPRLALSTNREVIRPLLEVSRHEVISFLEAEGITPRHDSSNLDLSLTRNRIRHELLPTLRRSFNSDISAILSRLAVQVRDLQQNQETEARRVLSEAEKPKAGAVVVLAVDRLSRERRDIVREVFHLIWEREQWPLPEMNFAHWDRLAGLVFDSGIAHDFPGFVHARRKGTIVQLFSRSPPANASDSPATFS